MSLLNGIMLIQAYSRFSSLKPNIVQGVGLVIVDELQLITDDRRGPGLEAHHVSSG